MPTHVCGHWSKLKGHNMIKGAAIGIGAALGVAFGAMNGHLALSLAIGTAIGAALEATQYVNRLNKRRREHTAGQ
jgi:hypothetical protein